MVEIGPENVVHVVTDNGSNYKKACKELREVYEHIAWTPYLAHTVNLILKDIARTTRKHVSLQFGPAHFSLGGG